MGALDWASNMFQGGLEQMGSGLINTFLGGIGERRRARINYEYGEKAAQNAFKRQMQLYQISKQDNSPEARRQQLEDAGMSVGLMYGGGGMAGGGAGSTTGAQMGATGTSAGMDSHANPYAFSMQKAEIETAQANAELAKANAKKATQEARGQEIQNEINNDTKNALKSIIENNAWLNFYDRARKEIQSRLPEYLKQEYSDEKGINTYPEGLSEEFDSTVKDSYMNWTIDADKGSLLTQSLRAELYGMIIDSITKEQEANGKYWLGKTNREEFIHFTDKLNIAWTQANASQMVAEAQEEANRINREGMEYKYGVKVTPLMIIREGCNVIATGARAYGEIAAPGARRMAESWSMPQERIDTYQEAIDMLDPSTGEVKKTILKSGQRTSKK